MKKHPALALCLLALLALSPAAGAEAEMPMVHPATQTILLNGETKELHAYAIHDSNGFATNYVKLRDMAALLSQTTARFDVGWSDGVDILPGRPYLSPNGQENQAPYEGDQPYHPATADTRVDGQKVDIDAFVILDSEGGGSTYYKLRDLGRALDFNVTWLGAEEGVMIDTSISYRE